MTASPHAGPHSCPDFRMSRRRMLGTSLAVGGGLATAQMFGDAFRQVTYGAEPNGNVVVVLSFRGGADGLSIVVPRGTDHDRLAEWRPTIAVPESQLLGDDARFGLHPSLAPLMPMWTAGSFGAVHSVGLPVPNRSHFDAMVEIEDADPGSSARVGWINRVVGLDADAEARGLRLPRLDPPPHLAHRPGLGPRRLPRRRPADRRPRHPRRRPPHLALPDVVDQRHHPRRRRPRGREVGRAARLPRRPRRRPGPRPRRPPTPRARSRACSPIPRP